MIEQILYPVVIWASAFICGWLAGFVVGNARGWKKGIAFAEEVQEAQISNENAAAQFSKDKLNG